VPFLDRFRPTITIIASPTEFRFVGPKAESRHQPLIRLAPDRKLIAVGETATADSQGGELVRLFERPVGLERSSDWFNADAFTRFCRYNLLVAAENSLWFMKPNVRVIGRRYFRDLFAGREVEVLSPLLLEAGAARVTFDE
jgi:hypothetical protein